MNYISLDYILHAPFPLQCFAQAAFHGFAVSELRGENQILSIQKISAGKVGPGLLAELQSEATTLITVVQLWSQTGYRQN
jgi:hypothetical protein